MKSWQITSNSHCGFFQLHLKVSRWEVRRHNFNSSFWVSVCGGFLFCFLRFGWVGWRCTGYEKFLKIFPSMPASWPFNRWPFLVLYTLSTVFSWQSLLAKDNDTGQPDRCCQTDQGMLNRHSKSASGCAEMLGKRGCGRTQRSKL